MVKSRISNSKADKVAEILSKSKYDQSISEINDQTSKLISEAYERRLPQDIKEINIKYPDLISKTSMDGIHIPTKDRDYQSYVRFYVRFYFKSSITMDLSLKDLCEKEDGLYNKLVDLSMKKEELCTDRRSLKNQISCAIESLGTYSKLKKNFPEAYKVLVEQIDEEVPQKISNPCDAVENVRAKLSKDE